MNDTAMFRWGFVCLSAAAIACSSAKAGPAVTETSDAGAPEPAAAKAYLRVAHLSPDAPPVDICVAAHGSGNFSGPVFAAAGAPKGLAYANVTKYLDVPAAQLDVRIVAPDAPDCSKSLAGLPDYTNLPALPAGAHVTVAAEGEVAAGDVPFGLHAYIDEASVDADKARLRFVHASPGTGAVDVGLGGGVLFTPVFSDVAFGGTSAAASTDNGYVETAPLVNVEISARAHGTSTDVLSITPASLPAGAIATAFAVGVVGNGATPLKVLLCVDNAAPSGFLSSCSLVGGTPKRARIRVAHLSPDAPAVDVCVAQTGSGTFAGPLLHALGGVAGLSFPQVTTYVDFPIATYDLRIVAAPATACGSRAVPDTTGVALADGLVATVAALGDLDPAGSDPAFRLGVFVDDATVQPADGALRFVHASPGTPAVDVGLLGGKSFTAVFTDVAFGNVAAAGGPIDPHGYYVGAPMSMVTVAARPAGTSTDALTVPDVSLPSGAIATAFAIGGKTGDAAHPLSVLLCVDNAPPNGLLSSCQ
jgi:hypothetical protein